MRAGQRVRIANQHGPLAFAPVILVETTFSPSSSVNHPTDRAAQQCTESSDSARDSNLGEAQTPGAVKCLRVYDSTSNRKGR